MTAGTFTVVIDPYEIVGTGVDPDASGRLTVRFQGGGTSAVVAGDLIVLDEFSRRGALAPSVSAGYELELATDVASGGDPETSAVGYDLTWTNGEATVTALFVGQPDGSTVNLSDLVSGETIPTAQSSQNADRAEAAADAAAESAGAAGAYASSAATEADRAQEAADLAEGISGLTGEDDAVGLLFGTPSSETRTATDLVYGTQLLPTDPQFGAVGDGVTDDTTALLAWMDALIGSGSVTNLAPNPSVEVTEDWATVSGSTEPARSTEQAWVGSYSVKFARGSGTSVELGRRTNFTSLLPGAGTYRVSARVWVSSTITGDAGLRATGSGVTNTSDYATARDAWEEVTFTITWDGVGSITFSVVDMSTTAGAVIYLDGLIVTAGSTHVDYFDGNTPDTGRSTYSWNGSAGSSTSTHIMRGAVEGVLPAGTFRVTGPLKRRDSGVPLTIRGAGSSQTYLYGDFIGAGEAIIDLSNEDATSYSTGGHHISGIGFLGNGVAGDPQGLFLKNANGCVVSDIRVDHGINGDHSLCNSGVVVTNDNNSTFNNINLRGGFQPKAFDLGVATVSFTSGSPTITATASVFTAAMVGKTIYFPDGSNNGSHDAWKATITAQSGTTATIDINAPSTASGIGAVVGHVTGSITAGTDQLTLDNIVGLSDDYVGMQVHVMGAAEKGNAGDKPGLLSTRVVSVSGNTLTLENDATLTVASATVLFCPALFVGSFGDEIAEAGRQVNDSWWTDVRCISYQAAGLIVNTAIYLRFDNLKIHGPGIQRPDWGQAYYSAVFSEVKHVVAKGLQADYTILGPKIHVSGSRGTLELDHTEVGQMWPASPIVLVENVTDDFRLYPGTMHLMYDLTNFPTTWVPFSSPLRSHVQGGRIVPRTKDRTLSKSRPIVQPGITGQEGGGIGIPDDTVMTFRPHGSTNGFLFFNHGKGNNVHGIIKYRTSEDTAGAFTAGLILGSDAAVTTGALTGTTGTDGKVTVSADASGNLQIENRRGSTIFVSLYWGPFGF